MKLNVLNSQRMASFTQEQKDIVQAGVELYKHYLYIKDKNKYSQYSEAASDGKSYEEKEKIYNESLTKEAFKRAGIVNSGFSDTAMMRNPNVQWALFELISETLAVIIPNTVLNQFEQFAEVRNGNWGDNFKFTIPNPNLFVVSKVGNGVRRGEPQRLYNSDLVLTPVPHEVTIQEDLYRILAGKTNWGDWITCIGLSVQTQIGVDIYNQLFNSYNNLNPNFKEAAWDKEAFVKLAQRVEAANAGAKVTVFGTRLALSKVVPDADFSKFGYVGIGEEYNRNGYLANFMGVSAFMIDQRIKANDPNFEFAIDDNTLYFVCMATDKPIKIGFEGSPLIFQDTSERNADLTQNYTYQQYWETAVATSSRYGIMKV